MVLVQYAKLQKKTKKQNHIQGEIMNAVGAPKRYTKAYREQIAPNRDFDDDNEYDELLRRQQKAKTMQQVSQRISEELQGTEYAPSIHPLEFTHSKSNATLSWTPQDGLYLLNMMHTVTLEQARAIAAVFED